MPSTAPDALYRWQVECERSGGDCAARIEALALRQPWARALRRGPALTLFTLVGEMSFLDVPADGRRYRYLGLLAPGSAHLVEHRSAGISGFLTVCDLTGQQTHFQALPPALRRNVNTHGELALAR